MAYWLVKSEPTKWSWEMQVAAGEKGTHWNGVRNHLAKLQLMARAIGPIRAVKREHALEARGYRGAPKYVSATFNYLAREIIRKSDEVLT